MKNIAGWLLPVVLLTLFVVSPSHAQHEELAGDSGMERVLNNMFNDFLIDQLNLGQGFHASHYVPAATTAQDALAPALSNLLSRNVASFPLSATQVGIVLDFSTGVPVKIIDRQGPIFAQTGQTLGQNHFSAGVNYTHLNLTRFRGASLDDLTFTFTHEDFAGEGGNGIVGDEPTERDLVIIRPDLDLTAGILALYASYGVLENLDIGVALPIVTVRAAGVADATIESWTLENMGQARHFLGGTPESPVLQAVHRYEESDTYLHSIALQAKYQLPLGGAFDSAVLVDVRIPTGSTDHLLGKGALNWYLGFVASGELNVFNPHVNVVYNGRGESWDSDRVSYVVGFDRPLADGVTVALDLLGDVAIDNSQTIRFYDPNAGPVTPVYSSYPGTPRDVLLSNVDDRDHDNTLNLSAGTRVAFSQHVQALANLLVPLTSSGLYATWVPTAGLTVIL